MKNLLIATLVVGCLGFSSALMAQNITLEKEERVEKNEKPGKKETQEIIIRKKGDKEMNLTINIKGDKITVNGKPLAEFKDSDVVINKKKMFIIDGDKQIESNSDEPSSSGIFNFGENFGKNFMEDMEGNEASNKAFLGVRTEETSGGVKISEVVKGSAAEKAGLKKGDIITKIANEKITSPEVLSDVVGFKKPSDEVKITYKRDGKEGTVKAVLGKAKNNRVRQFSFNLPKGGQVFPFGNNEKVAPFTNMEGFNDNMIELSENAMKGVFPSRKNIGLKIQDTEDGGNVKVINVEDSSAAAIAGLKKDDLITEINGKKIANTDDAREELQPGEDKKSYKIKVQRYSKEMEFEVKIPKKLNTANL